MINLLIIIPLSRLHIESPIILQNITLSSKIVVNNFDHILIGGNYYSFNLLNKSKVLDLFDESFAIYILEKIEPCKHSSEIVDRLINPVDYALDSLRISLNNFTFHEQAIGTPGFFKGSKVAVVLQDNCESYDIITGEKIYYQLLEGIGCDATDFSSENHILQLAREDEVYTKYRNILHQVFKAIQIYDANTCFAYLFSTIESLDCCASDKFREKKRRILSLIANNQNEFDVLSQQFYFYSKTVRTKVIHAGKSLYDILSWKKVYNLLDDLYLLVVKFCMAAIQSGATEFSELNKEISNKYNLFSYTSPHDDIAIEQIPTTVSAKCDYFAEINNLSIDVCLKLGVTLFLPANSKSRIGKFREVYEYGLKLCMVNGLEEMQVKVDSNFPNYYLFSDFNTDDKSFTVWDVDIILTALLRNINNDTPLAIMENQDYWENPSTGFNASFYFEFTDIICNRIQEALNYLVISCQVSNNTILPSKVGINSDGIRAAYINLEGSSTIRCIPGRCYSEYTEPSSGFYPSLDNFSAELYDCFFSSYYDEVFLTNKNALNKLASSIYFQDISQMLLEVFDVMDMLYPTTYDGAKLHKRIATFCCNTKNQKLQLLNRLNELRKEIRNPLLHSGKSIYDIQLTQSDAYAIINELKCIIVKYCESVCALNVHSFKELREEEKKKIKFLESN